MVAVTVPQETGSIQPIERPKLRLMLRIGGYGFTKDWREEVDVFVAHAFKLATKGRIKSAISELDRAIIVSEAFDQALALSIEARRELWLSQADYSPDLFRIKIASHHPTPAMLIDFLGKVMGKTKEDIEVSTAQFLSEYILNVTTVPSLERLLDLTTLVRKRLGPGHTDDAMVLLTELAKKFYTAQLRYASDVLDKMPDTEAVTETIYPIPIRRRRTIYMDGKAIDSVTEWEHQPPYTTTSLGPTHARERAARMRENAAQFHKRYLEGEI